MFNEVIGILATIIILIAFLMKGEKKIRILDSVGALIFVVYGILIGSVSNIILNLALFIINVVNIIRLNKENNGV